MSGRKISRAKWSRHLSAITPPHALRDWLTSKGSLTASLKNHCKRFHIQCLKQRQEICLTDDIKPIGLSRRCKTQVREVLLVCDGQPVVFAHSIITSHATSLNWPMLKKLGNNSLGSLLFANPEVTREIPQFARLSHTHALSRRIRTALPEYADTASFYARRCLYRRKRGAMLVTEIFLPEITHLHTRLAA